MSFMGFWDWNHHI